MFKKLKDKKGFTLVELIVVLVILAILAALLIPALTGYIDKARKESVVAETRSAVMAAQTIVSEKYGTTKGDVTLATTDYEPTTMRLRTLQRYRALLRLALLSSKRLLEVSTRAQLHS